MDLGPAGRTAVVTGGGKGIGRAIVTALVAQGVQVTAGARSFAWPPTGSVRPVQVNGGLVGTR